MNEENIAKETEWVKLVGGYEVINLPSLLSFCDNSGVCVKPPLSVHSTFPASGASSALQPDRGTMPRLYTSPQVCVTRYGTFFAAPDAPWQEDATTPGGVAAALGISPPPASSRVASKGVKRIQGAKSRTGTPDGRLNPGVGLPPKGSRSEGASPMGRQPPCLSIGTNQTVKESKIRGKGEKWTSRLEIYSGDVVLKRWNNEPKEEKQYRGDRKACFKFSDRMRLEFCRQVRNQPELNRVGVSGVATVTYGKNHPKDSETLRTHIHNFTRRLKRDGVGGYYMIEFQEERRAVHVHFILSKFVPHEDWAAMWCECSGQAGDIDVYNVHVYKHPDHTNRHMTQVLRTSAGASFYAAKYASKAGLQKTIPEDFNWSGRWWGHFGMGPVKPEIVIEGSASEDVGIRRILRRKAKSEQRAYRRARVQAELDRTIRAEALLDAFHLSPGLSYQEAEKQGSSCGVGFSRLLRNGRDCRSWQDVSNAERKVILKGMMSNGVIRCQRKSKDWDKLTCYGQGKFLTKHINELRRIWVRPEVNRLMSFFGGRVINTQSIEVVKRKAS